MRRTGMLLAVATLVLSGCAQSATQPAQPSSRVAALAVAVTATAEQPTATAIVLPTATPAPTDPAAPSAVAETSAAPATSDAAALQLAPPPSGRANAGPASRATAPPQPEQPVATPSPEPAGAAPTTEPLPPGPRGGPVAVPTPMPDDGESTPLDDTNRPLVERATRMLATELGIAVDAVTLVRIDPVVWSDGGLGCARPDEIVQPVETPGYRIVLAAAGAQYEYHTDLERQVRRC